MDSQVLSRFRNVDAIKSSQSSRSLAFSCSLSAEHCVRLVSSSVELGRCRASDTALFCADSPRMSSAV